MGLTPKTPLGQDITTKYVHEERRTCAAWMGTRRTVHPTTCPPARSVATVQDARIRSALRHAERVARLLSHSDELRSLVGQRHNLGDLGAFGSSADTNGPHIAARARCLLVVIVR